MNKLLTEACNISDVTNNSICASLVWGGSTRVIKHFGRVGDKEIAQYLTLAGLAPKVAAEIRPTAAEIIKHVSQPPVKIVPNATQRAMRIERGETDESIDEATAIVYQKKVVKFHEDMRALRKNKSEITELLTKALDGELPTKRLLSYTDDIVHERIRTKLTVRKAVLMDNIYNGYLPEESEAEIDAIYVVLDQVEGLVH